MDSTPNQDPSKLVDREFAQAWRPAPGDKLVGEIVELGARSGYDGELYPIVTVRQSDGSELAAHAFHTVLKHELAKLRPQVGQQIAIKYEGEIASASGRSRYHGYRVATDNPAAFSWGAFGEDSNTGGSDIPSDIDNKPEKDDDIPF